METKQEKVLRQAQAMVDGATANQEKGLDVYAMHACCAIEFAQEVQELVKALPQPMSKRCRVELKNENGNQAYETDTLLAVFKDGDGVRAVSYFLGGLIEAIGMHAALTGIIEDLESQFGNLKELSQDFKRWNDQNQGGAADE